VPHHRSGVTTTVAADEVRLLLQRRHRPLPHEVGRDAVLVLVDHDPQAAQRLEHLDAERADREVHAVAELLRRPQHPVVVAALHARERVLDGEIRVLPHAEHHEQRVARGVQVEVVAVVEVPIARRDEADRLGGLVHRKVVPAGEHGGDGAHLAAPEATGRPCESATSSGSSTGTPGPSRYCAPTRQAHPLTGSDHFAFQYFAETNSDCLGRVMHSYSTFTSSPFFRSTVAVPCTRTRPLEMLFSSAGPSK
jgi:hypothetical protein